MSDLDSVGQFADHERASIHLRALRAYSGHPQNPLQIRNGIDDNLIISLARLVVDKGASFLFGQPVTSELTGDQPEPKQDWLNECWRRNKRQITLLKLATNGGIFGHAFARLIDVNPYPRVIIVDPQTVQVLTDPDDCDTPWKFTITPPPAPVEQGDQPIKRRTIIANPSGIAGYRVDADEPWTIIDQQVGGGAWVNVAQTTWPYPFCPIVHCQNIPKPNDFWGESDLPEDVLKILNGINRIASNYGKIVRLHAHPKIYTTGMGKATIDAAIDSIIMLPSETAQLRALEMQSDLSSTMALLEKLLSLLSYMVRIPLVAMGEPDNLGAISGVALQIRYQPLIEKTEAKRLTYGDALVELDRCLLAMAVGRDFGDAAITHLTWPELLPSDPLQERQVALIDDEMQIASKETLAKKLGYSLSEEQAKRITENQSMIAGGLTPDPMLQKEEGKLEPVADTGGKAQVSQ